MTRLSAVIITLNEEGNIRRCLESLAGVVGEIVVVDSGSVDRTAAICREAGCRVYERKFDGYGAQKQFAVDQASNDWVLSVDADEVLSEELRHELFSLFAGSGKETPGGSINGHAGFEIPFSMFFMGRIMRYSGLGNERHLRLFSRSKGRFTTAAVHEGVEIDGFAGQLKGRIIHHSYRDISHHLAKINVYTTQAAGGYRARNKRFPKFWVGLKFPVSFLSFYILKLGFLDGYPGFMWSLLAAVYASLKVAKTIELNETQ